MFFIRPATGSDSEQTADAAADGSGAPDRDTDTGASLSGCNRPTDSVRKHW